MSTPAPKKVHLEVQGHHRHVCGAQRYDTILFTTDPARVTCQNCLDFFRYKEQVKVERSKQKSVEPRVLERRDD